MVFGGLLDFDFCSPRRTTQLSRTAKVKFSQENRMADRYRNCIGPSVRRLRAQKGWTQEEFAGQLQLAGLLHFGRVIVAKIECQNRSVYDYEMVLIAKVLNVEPQVLLPSPEVLQPDLSRLIGDRKD